MSEPSYNLFRSFGTWDQVEPITELLKQHKIDYKIVDNSHSVDITFTGGGSLQNEVQLLIPQDSFKLAEQLLNQQAEEWLSEVDDDHYLFEFDDVELLEILSKPDEWNSFDYQLAQKILADRGINMDDTKLEQLKQKRLDELEKPDSLPSYMVSAGYITALLGGLFGIFLGWYINSGKKTLPDGRKVYSYSNIDRKRGVNMVTIGLLSLVVWTIILFWHNLTSL